MGTLFRPVGVFWYVGSKRVPAKNRPPGAKKRRVRNPYWYARYTDHRGQRHTVKLDKNKSEAERMLSEIEAKEIRLARGLDVVDERLTIPLQKHLERFQKYLEGKNNTEKHVRLTITRIDAILAGTGTKILSELQPAVVLEWLAEQRKNKELPELLPPERKKGEPEPTGYTLAEVIHYTGANHQCVSRMISRMGLSATGWGKSRRYPKETVATLREYLSRGQGLSTSNHYITAIKGFIGWLVDDLSLARNPLAPLSRLNADVDVRVERRVLPPAQFLALLDASRQGKPDMGLSGEDRTRLYLTAARTGFRASELASLTPASFDREKLIVTVEAGYSKHKRRDVQPILADVLEVVSPLLEKTPKGQPLWPGNWPDRAAQMLRTDLDQANIVYLLDGKRFDFHALRCQFINDLLAAGVAPKEVQALARHSTITLTMDTYGRADSGRMREALERLNKKTPN